MGASLQLAGMVYFSSAILHLLVCRGAGIEQQRNRIIPDRWVLRYCSLPSLGQLQECVSVRLEIRVDCWLVLP